MKNLAKIWSCGKQSLRVTLNHFSMEAKKKLIKWLAIMLIIYLWLDKVTDHSSFIYSITEKITV